MASSKEELLKNTIKCKLCLEVIVTPRALTCLHTFCHACVENLVENHQESGKFPCPECRKDCLIPDEGAKGFKVNFLVNSIKDAIGDGTLFQKHEELLCEFCDVDGKPKKAKRVAKYKCLECNKRLCKSCFKFHAKVPHCEDHKIIDLSGDSSHDMQLALKSMPERTLFCLHHPKKPLEYFCEEDKTLVCQTCFIVDHQGHPCKEIHAIGKGFKDILKEAINAGQVKSGNIQESINDTEQCLNEIDQNTKEAKQTLDLNEQTIYDAIKDFFDRMKKQLDKEKESKDKQVLAHLNDLQLNKELTDGMIDNLTTLDQYGHVAEIINMAQETAQKKTEWEADDQSLEFLTIVKICIFPTRINADTVTLPIVKKEFKISDKVNVLSSGELTEPKEAKAQGIFDASYCPNDNLIITGNVSSFYKYSEDMKLVSSNKNDVGLSYVNLHSDNDTITFTTWGTDILIYSECNDTWNTRTIKGAQNLLSISQTKTKNIILCDKEMKAVFILDQEGKEILHDLGQGMFEFPYMAVVNCNNYLMVSDRGSHCIKAINMDTKQEIFTYGGTQGSADGELNTPHGICVDAADNIIIADCFNDRVVLISPDGKFIKNLLTETDGLYWPWCVAINSKGHLFVGCTKCKYFMVQYTV